MQTPRRTASREAEEARERRRREALHEGSASEDDESEGAESEGVASEGRELAGEGEGPPLITAGTPIAGAGLRPIAFVRGSLWWPILRLGLPLAVGMASHALFNLVDLLLVGRLGPAAVAGVHVATTINFVPMILGNSISVATMSLISRLLGAGHEARARDLSSRSQLLMIVLGVLVGVLGAVFTVPCIELQGVSGQARAIGIHYLLIMNLGTVTMFVLMQSTATMRSEGEVWMPFSLLIGANLLNLGLAWVLLFGWSALSIPQFGAVGAAYATVIARGLAGAVGLWWIRRPAKLLRFSWVPFRGPRGERRTLFMVGLPHAMQMFLRAVAIIALTRVAGDLAGVDAITALGVTTRLDTMILFAAVGFGSAATTIVGRNVGAGKARRARAACRRTAFLAMAFGGGIVWLLATFAHEIVDVFVVGADQAVLENGARYLRIAALGQPLAAFCIAVTGGINGAGRMWPPMLLDLAGYLGILLPAAILVASLADVRLEAIWWIVVAANFCIALMYWCYLERAAWPYARRHALLPS